MIPHANGQTLRVSVYKFLDMAYGMIDLNTLSIVCYPMTVIWTKSSQNFSYPARITTASVLFKFKRILTYRPKIDPALTSLSDILIHNPIFEHKPFYTLYKKLTVIDWWQMVKTAVWIRYLTISIYLELSSNNLCHYIFVVLFKQFHNARSKQLVFRETFFMNLY